MSIKKSCRVKIGFTAGTWDFVHAGHVLHFKECKKHCDLLIVGLQVDPSLDRPEKSKPIMSLSERLVMLQANKYVDGIIIYERESDLCKLDEWFGDIRFMGIDHKGKKHHKINAKIMYLSGDRSISSSGIRKRINNENISNRT